MSTTEMGSSPDAFARSHAFRGASFWTSLNMAASAALRTLSERRRAQRDYDRLMTMSDRELDDIGVTRAMAREARDELYRNPFGRI